MDVELFRPFNVIFSVLKRLGLWQNGRQNWVYLMFGSVFHFTFRELQLTGALISLLSVKSFEEFADISVVISIIFSGLIRSWNFLANVRKIEKSVENLKSLIVFSCDERSKNRESVKSQVKFAYKIFKFNWSLAILTASIATLRTILSHQLPFKTYFPFDTEDSEIGFFCAVTIKTITFYSIGTIDVALSILPIIFISFAVGLMNELSDRLSLICETSKYAAGTTSSKTTSDDVGDDEELKKCIKIHVKIIKFTQEIHKNFSRVIFVQGFASSVILCTIASFLSTVTSTKNK